MASLSNSLISIEVANKGAELQSLYHTQFQKEYMWNADPNFWAKQSPVLFPIVGGLKNNTYEFSGKQYKLNRHGFAREMEFELISKTENSLTFSLSSNKETLLVYPFLFQFNITYTLQQNTLEIKFEVKNTGNEKMYFSVGAHPAFAVPLLPDSNYEDHYLLFSEEENIGKHPLTPDGLIEETTTPFLNNENILPLSKKLFEHDAIVLKNLRSGSISIRSNKNEHGVKVNFPDFPYMGIWAAKGADFVCIEPWCGIADSVNTSGKLEEKEGINTLEANEIFTRAYSIEIF